MTSKRQIFGIFEGGGAKGIAHIGAWKAAEDAELEFVAVAGASAGAIVATLIAAGYKASDVMDPAKKDQDVLSSFNTSPTQLLGTKDWEKFHHMHQRLERLFDTSPGIHRWLCGLWCLACHCCSGKKRSVGGRVLAKRGFFSTDLIRHFVNQVLRERLHKIYEARGIDLATLPERVLFRHLDCDKFEGDLVPLKIVATNLQTRELEIFDNSPETGHVEVGEAVAASIAIPLVFEPVIMHSNENRLYADGGLVSNLPAWAILEEKLRHERKSRQQPRASVVGFTLEDIVKEKKSKYTWRWKLRDRLRRAIRWSTGGWLYKTPTPPPPIKDDFFEYLMGVGRTAIFGSQIISQRFIEDLKIISIKTTLDVLDFDKDWNTLCEAWKEGYRDAAAGLDLHIITKPDIVLSKLKEIVDRIVTKINDTRKATGRSPLTNARGNVVEKYGSDSFRVVYGYNMDPDADDRLLLDGRGGGAVRAFKDKQLTSKSLDVDQPIDFMTKYEQAQLRRALKYVICVPIFHSRSEWEKPDEERETPLGVFCFDSDEGLEIEYKDIAIMRLLSLDSVILGEALRYGA